MCGIAGMIAPKIRPERREEIVRRMVRALRHRGPDDEGVMSSGPATFGTARLSIVDRAKGAQPMMLGHGSKSGLISYNGEVYNFEQLRRRLANDQINLKTRSDTEVVLATHLVYGMHAVEEFDGMFAYGLWQTPADQLLLVRDRLGIKPLYYFHAPDVIVFASEPKALLCDAGIERDPDFTAVLEYFLHGYAFAAGYTTHDRSFFKNIKSLPPAHLLTWSSGDGVKIRRYWSPLDEIGTQPFSEESALEDVREGLSASVKSMLLGEVPIGTALSGGLDSSIITVLTANSLEQKLTSSCITYREDTDDPDAFHAKLVSRTLNDSKPGSHVLEFAYLSEENYLNRLDEMIGAFDEPHWEPRQLAMFENYRVLAEAGCTVVLTGEGADELFYGYYQKFPGFRLPVIETANQFGQLWRQRLPLVEELLSPAFSSGLIASDLPDQLIDESLNLYLTPYWSEPGDRLRAVQCWYLQTFLPWLLMDNDRCGMAHSIEGRFPFLSNQLVSLALRLPPQLNIATNGEMREKVLLRRAVSDMLPAQIWRDRNKSPLPVPNAASYHAKIAHMLSEQLERAHQEIWDVIDKQCVRNLIHDFDVRRKSMGPNDGDTLTGYIPLGDPHSVRTAQLFGILTFIRWFDLNIAQPGRGSYV